MFRNVRFYHLHIDWPENETSVSKALESAAFKPCGPLTERSSGWIPVDPDAGDSLARRVNGADLLRLRSQSRILPHAAVNEALEARVEAYRERMNEAPSAREKRRLKAETRDELLPKSMLKSDRIWGFVDAKESVIAVDAATESTAERFLRRLQTPFDGLKAAPLKFARPVDELLTRIFLDGTQGRFTVGRECRMQDVAEARSIVRWSDFDLEDATIRGHLANGMRLTHLAMIYDNSMSFVMNENGVITKLRFLGLEDDADDSDEAIARLDSGFVLLTGMLRKMLADLRKALGPAHRT